jgi:hypothetical protein
MDKVSREKGRPADSENLGGRGSHNTGQSLVARVVSWSAAQHSELCSRNSAFYSQVARSLGISLTVLGNFARPNELGAGSEDGLQARPQ